MMGSDSKPNSNVTESCDSEPTESINQDTRKIRIAKSFTPIQTSISQNLDAFSDQIDENTDLAYKVNENIKGHNRRNKSMKVDIHPMRRVKSVLNNRRLTVVELKDKERDIILDKFEKENEKYLASEVDSTPFLLARLDKYDQNEVEVEEDDKPTFNDKVTHPIFKTDVGPEELSSNYVPVTLPPNHREPILTSSESDVVSPYSPTPSENGTNISDETPTDPSSFSAVYENLPDWEFWCTVVHDYAGVAHKTPHLLTAKIRLGIPSVLRGALWQTMSQSGSTYLETMYNQLLEEKNFPFEKIILRDVPRTFPRLPMFAEEFGVGQTRLYNIMKAYSLYDTEVGYCQGLGFMMGPLLMNMPEVEAFCVFVRLMETYDMRTMFTTRMEGLRLRLYQLGALISEYIPKLANHLNSHNISTALYASQWFLSLFAYTFPLSLVQRIYDVVFAEGAPETIMRVAIALLQKNLDKLLAIDEFEGLISFLTSAQLFEAYNNSATMLINDAILTSSKVSKRKLDELAEQYSREADTSSFCYQKPSMPQKTSHWVKNILSNLYSEGSLKARSMSRHPSQISVISATDSESTHSSFFFMNPENSSTHSHTHRSSRKNGSELNVPTTEVEVLRLAVHDLQTTTETHLTALTQLRHDHSQLKSDMVHIKSEKFTLQEENELLRHELLKSQKEAQLMRKQGREALLRQQEYVQCVEKQLLDANMHLKRLQDERDSLLRSLELNNTSNINNNTNTSEANSSNAYPYLNIQSNFAGTFRKFLTKS